MELGTILELIKAFGIPAIIISAIQRMRRYSLLPTTTSTDLLVAVLILDSTVLASLPSIRSLTGEKMEIALVVGVVLLLITSAFTYFAVEGEKKEIVLYNTNTIAAFIDSNPIIKGMVNIPRVDGNESGWNWNFQLATLIGMHILVYNELWK